MVFDEQGHVVSANRRADNLLGQPLTYGAIEQLFDVPLQQLLNQPDGQPFSLRTSSHFRFHARVRRPARPAPIQPRDFRPQATQSTPQEPQLHTLSAGDARMDKAVRQAERLLEKDIPILVQGETGAGKEVFVKALHQASSRASQPFIAVNCAAIPAELVESELFGYEKGAFTGACLLYTSRCV